MLFSWMFVFDVRVFFCELRGFYFCMKWFTKGYITGDGEWIFGERYGAIRGRGDGL